MAEMAFFVAEGKGFGLGRYVIRRILFLIPTLLLVSFFVYAILAAAPGDPAQLALGEGATAAAVEMKRIELGLDKPLVVQYLNWLKKVVFEFNFGNSYRSGISVGYQIATYFPYTLKLSGLSVLLGVIIGIPIGVIAAVKQYSVFDNIVMSFAMIGMSIPAFVVALVMILLFSITLSLLPSSGFDSFNQMILPVIALGMQPMAICARMTRSSMLEVIRQDYIRTIRAKGQTEFGVIVGHALKNAFMPILTTLSAAAVLLSLAKILSPLLQGKRLLELVGGGTKDVVYFHELCLLFINCVYMVLCHRTGSALFNGFYYDMIRAPWYVFALGGNNWARLPYILLSIALPVGCTWYVRRQPKRWLRVCLWLILWLITAAFIILMGKYAREAVGLF